MAERLARARGDPAVAGATTPRRSDRHPDWVGAALVVLSGAVGLALVLLAAAAFIQMVR